MRKQLRGFTLVEMTLTVAILAVCAAVAAPVMGDLLERQRAGAAMGALATQMQLARMAAITYRQSAVLCPSRSGTACDGSTDWSGGWMMFLDRDGNREPDAGEDILRAESGPMSRSLRLLGTTGRPQLRYMPDGRSAGTNLTISVCNGDGILLGAVIVNNAGRPRTFRPTTPAACPG
ncbi:GspH/FimT family pseudopilin [Luteimonas kalidii]|uniref:Type II secretion system protein H n=1 Tax=Luteimonas kalidii TaxID=3042025 RepID=A0ABT6JZF8_9GAMM|nr:GspH/FimT family pseudopilin [Luteimonas kalidii]MDH5835551.1 GspH/FimT family pseudopilin [Luteimonas kalidii]